MDVLEPTWSELSPGESVAEEETEDGDDEVHMSCLSLPLSLGHDYNTRLAAPGFYSERGCGNV